MYYAALHEHARPLAVWPLVPAETLRIANIDDTLNSRMRFEDGTEGPISCRCQIMISIHLQDGFVMSAAHRSSLSIKH